MIGLFLGRSVALKTVLFERYILNGGRDDCENVNEENRLATQTQTRVIDENFLFMVDPKKIISIVYRCSLKL